MSSAGLVLPVSTTPRARTLYNTGGGLSISPSPTPSTYDRSSDCDTIPKPYRKTWYQPILVAGLTNIGSHHPLYEGLENAPYKRRPPHPTNVPRHYGASWMKLKTFIHKQLLVYTRTTIGLRCKQLFVSFANNYSFVPQTTIEPDANDYGSTSPPHEA